MVSLTCPSPQILGKTQKRVFPISEFLVNPLKTKNCYNSKTSHEINMELGPVPKLDRKNTKTSDKFDDDVISGSCDVIVFFPDLWSIWSNPEAGFLTHGL